MSLYDYKASRRIAGMDYSFHGLLMATMRQADSDNAANLRAAFPDVYDELQARYNGPGGLLPHESDQEAACPDCEDSLTVLEPVEPMDEFGNQGTREVPCPQCTREDADVIPY